MAEIKVTSRTATSFTMKVVNLDTSYTKDDRIYHIFISGGGYSNKDINEDGYSLDGGVTETPEHNIIGLTANTVYSIVVKFFSGSGALLSKLTHDTKTLEDGEEPIPPSPSVIIEPWDWHSSNKTATAAQTEKAYQALINKGSLKDFSHKVWNDLCYKVREIMLWREDEYVTFADSYLFGMNLLMNYTVRSGRDRYTTDKNMTASRYNDLLTGIRRSGITSISPVSVGDLITAAHFLDLVDDMNAIIADINKQ